MFQHRPNLLLGDAREPLDELVDRCAAAEVLEEAYTRTLVPVKAQAPLILAGLRSTAWQVSQSIRSPPFRHQLPCRRLGPRRIDDVRQRATFLRVPARL